MERLSMKQRGKNRIVKWLQSFASTRQRHAPVEYQNLVKGNDNVSNNLVSPSDEDEPNSSSIPNTEADFAQFQSVGWNYGE